MDDATVATPVTDEDILQQVKDAVWELEQVRSTHPPLDIEVEDGVVTLCGTMRSRTIAMRLAGRLARVPGVKQVVNKLHDDASIKVAVAAELARQEATRSWTPRIWINSLHGDVRLEGWVEDENVRLAAGKIAAEVPGVRTLTNDLSKN